MAYYPDDILESIMNEGRAPWGQDLDTVGSDNFEQSVKEFGWYQANPREAQLVKKALYPNGDINAYVKIGGFGAAHGSDDNNNRSSTRVQVAKLPDMDVANSDVPTANSYLVGRRENSSPPSTSLRSAYESQYGYAADSLYNDWRGVADLSFENRQYGKDQDREQRYQLPTTRAKTSNKPWQNSSALNNTSNTSSIRKSENYPNTTSSLYPLGKNIGANQRDFSIYQLTPTRPKTGNKSWQNSFALKNTSHTSTGRERENYPNTTSSLYPLGRNIGANQRDFSIYQLASTRPKTSNKPWQNSFALNTTPHTSSSLEEDNTKAEDGQGNNTQNNGPPTPVHEDHKDNKVYVENSLLEQNIIKTGGASHHKNTQDGQGDNSQNNWRLTPVDEKNKDNEVYGNNSLVSLNTIKKGGLPANIERLPYSLASLVPSNTQETRYDVNPWGVNYTANAGDKKSPPPNSGEARPAQYPQGSYTADDVNKKTTLEAPSKSRVRENIVFSEPIKEDIILNFKAAYAKTKKSESGWVNPHPYDDSGKETNMGMTQKTTDDEHMLLAKLHLREDAQEMGKKDVDLVRKAYHEGRDKILNALIYTQEEKIRLLDDYDSRPIKVSTKDFAMNDLNYAVALDVWYAHKKMKNDKVLTPTENNVFGICAPVILPKLSRTENIPRNKDATIDFTKIDFRRCLWDIPLNDLFVVLEVNKKEETIPSLKEFKLKKLETDSSIQTTEDLINTYINYISTKTKRSPQNITGEKIKKIEADFRKSPIPESVADITEDQVMQYFFNQFYIKSNIYELYLVSKGDNDIKKVIDHLLDNAVMSDARIPIKQLQTAMLEVVNEKEFRLTYNKMNSDEKNRITELINKFSVDRYIGPITIGLFEIISQKGFGRKLDQKYSHANLDRLLRHRNILESLGWITRESRSAPIDAAYIQKIKDFLDKKIEVLKKKKEDLKKENDPKQNNYNYLINRLENYFEDDVVPILKERHLWKNGEFIEQ